MSERSPGKPELWVAAAFALVLVLLAGVVYLGLRPGGRGPIWVYGRGRDLLALTALGLLLVGAAQSALRRPFVRRRRIAAFACLLAVVGIAPTPFPYPSSHEGKASSVRFRLPCRGEWTVLWGGDRKDQNPFAAWSADRRWALHLVRVEEGRRTRSWAEPPRAGPEDFLAWTEPVLSPAAGEVVQVRDGVPDGDLVDVPEGTPASGNLVVLRVADDEYLFASHLRAGSIPLTVGERVQAGALLGTVGASGVSPLTPEPHIAIHLQDSPEERWGEAVPWFFHDYVADGVPVARGSPRGGVGSGGVLVGQRVAQGSE